MIDVQTQTLAWRNRRVLARRGGWPAGALAECERLDREYPAWSFHWLTENRLKGWEHPAGFSARRLSGYLVGGDEMRRAPEDNVLRKPHVFGPDVPALLDRIAAVEVRIAAKAEAERRLWASVGRGLR